MKPTGKIHVHENYNALGDTERRTYEWRDGPYAEVRTHYISFPRKVGASCWVGPYRVRLVEEIGLGDCFVVVRQDWPFWWVFVAWHRVNRLIDIAYRRSIITLNVWGLAERDQAMPCWRHIKIVRRFREWREDRG